VDLLIGNSYGARIASEEDIPLLRIGFPIYDRMGAQRTPIVGYSAGILLVDTLANIILEKYYDASGWEIE
jgi:nitrogenase molybdenum-iron protein beta chain/nitrogenase molybdenum-iron protein NifN